MGRFEIGMKEENTTYSDRIAADLKALASTVDMIIRDLSKEGYSEDRMKHILDGICQTAIIKDRIARGGYRLA